MVDTEQFDDFIESFAPTLRDAGWQIISAPTERLEVFPTLTVALESWVPGQPPDFIAMIYCGRRDDPYSYRAGHGYAVEALSAIEAGTGTVTAIGQIDNDQYVMLGVQMWSTHVDVQ